MDMHQRVLRRKPRQKLLQGRHRSRVPDLGQAVARPGRREHADDAVGLQQQGRIDRAKRCKHIDAHAGVAQATRLLQHDGADAPIVLRTVAYHDAGFNVHGAPRNS